MGWGRRWRRLLVDHVELADAAGTDATLWAPVATFCLAAFTVIPSLAYMYWITQRGPIAVGAPAD